MQTHIVIVSGSILNVSTVHLNGISHLIWRYLSKPVLGGHPILSGHYSIPRGCPLNTGYPLVNILQKRRGFSLPPRPPPPPLPLPLPASAAFHNKNVRNVS